MSATSRRAWFVAVLRGSFRVLLAGGLLAAVHGLFRRRAMPRPVERQATGILRPPGALDEPGFLAACIRCELCADACDTACIRIFGPTEGRHAGTPHIVAESRACNLCLRCTQVCPSGALQPIEDKKDVRMGTAVVDERLCVSHDGTGACGACHTVCPLRNRAITQGLFNAPTVHREHCVGCGLCEEACIVEERRAIRVVTGRSWA
jgi:ferredoxin-type protein NapG